MRFNALYNNIISRNLLTEERLPGVKEVIIYSGRFQPMLPHHAKVYNRLVDDHPDSEVYIATSDSVAPLTSPFNLKEKKRIMSQLYNIPEDRILGIKSVYNLDNYKDHFEANKTILFIAVGAKDQEETEVNKPRFPFNNIDPITGLDMNIKTGLPRPLQPFSAFESDPKTIGDNRAYILIQPTVTSQGKTSSASDFRADLRESDDPEKMLHDLFGDKVNPVKDLIINKITEE